MLKMNIYPGYMSKQNSNHEKQIIILIIPDGEGWNYLVVKHYVHYQEE